MPYICVHCGRVLNRRGGGCPCQRNEDCPACTQIEKCPDHPEGQVNHVDSQDGGENGIPVGS